MVSAPRRTTVVNVISGWVAIRCLLGCVMIVVLGRRRTIVVNVGSGWGAIKYLPIFVIIVGLGPRRIIAANVANGLLEMIDASIYH